jgi:hypothetical protein
LRSKEWPAVTKNGKMPTHQQRARSLADQLEDLPDEITGNHFIFPEKAKTTVDTDATGRVKVVSIPDAEEITRADHPRPETVPPRGKFILAVLNTIQPPWLRFPIVLALIGAVVLLILKGVKVWP